MAAPLVRALHPKYIKYLSCTLWPVIFKETLLFALYLSLDASTAMYLCLTASVLEQITDLNNDKTPFILGP